MYYHYYYFAVADHSIIVVVEEEGENVEEVTGLGGTNRLYWAERLFLDEVEILRVNSVS